MLIFVLSLFILIKASEYFTESSEKVGIFLGIPQFIVGVTIVAVGTSLPELVSSILAVFQDSSEIVIGNVVGSNLTNIFLIVGLAAVIGEKFKIKYELLSVDLPIFVGSAFLLGATVWDGAFSLFDALLCIAGYALYTFHTINVGRENGDDKEIRGQQNIGKKTLTVLLGSSILIYIGAKYMVESIINLSDLLGIGKEIIALTAVALGTSLPELMVSITAVKGGKPEIAIGNVLGSNIFNSFAVMGVSAMFGTLIIPQTILGFSLPLMVIATLLYMLITQDNQITRWEGWLLIIFYIFFLGKIFLAK